MTASVETIAEFMRFAGTPLNVAQVKLLYSMDLPRGGKVEGAHLTRDSLKALILAHESEHPDKGHYKVELRHFMLVHPPKTLKHDDVDEVLILAGTPGRY